MKAAGNFSIHLVLLTFSLIKKMEFLLLLFFIVIFRRQWHAIFRKEFVAPKAAIDGDAAAEMEEPAAAI